ncbi:uncharacterized protein LOC109538679 isoform X1 [Dendroctonus ponderosae]|uniref:uncharacterized protein LOC109538679 isoform X1 n=1 Tax=Dendroctonus ponderosae TaxID=77166 RepID=UPI002034EE27|nr:uncharacterized protein LOC109538679 isoform X1 [Dendroctonus ponderosae]
MLKSAFVCFALWSCAGLVACTSEVNRDAPASNSWGLKTSPLTKLFPFSLNRPNGSFHLPQFTATNWPLFEQKQQKETTTGKPWRLPSLFPFNVGSNSSWGSTTGKNYSNKIFIPAETVSKFPAVVEFFVQKIQASQSNYVYEDLSRPPTYDKPVFTLSPEDQIAFGLATSTKPPATPKPISNDDFDYEEIANNTETLFEIIKSTQGEDNIPMSSDLKSIFASYCKSLEKEPLQTPNFIEKEMAATSETDVGLPAVVRLRRSLVKGKEAFKVGAGVGKICSEMLKKTQEIRSEGYIHNEASTNVVHLRKQPVGQSDVSEENSRRTPTNHHGLPNVVYEAGGPIRSNQAQKENHGIPHVIFLRRLKESPNTQE